MGGLAYCSVIVLIVAFGPHHSATPARPATKQPEAAPMVQRTWNTSFHGRTVSCGIAGTERWQIMFPALEEREQGAEPVIDRAPEDYVWAKACGPSDPGH